MRRKGEDVPARLPGQRWGRPSRPLSPCPWLGYPELTSRSLLRFVQGHCCHIAQHAAELLEVFVCALPFPDPDWADDPVEAVFAVSPGLPQNGVDCSDDDWALISRERALAEERRQQQIRRDPVARYADVGPVSTPPHMEKHLSRVWSHQPGPPTSVQSYRLRGHGLTLSWLAIHLVPKAVRSCAPNGRARAAARVSPAARPGLVLPGELPVSGAGRDGDAAPTALARPQRPRQTVAAVLLQSECTFPSEPGLGRHLAVSSLPYSSL